MAKKKISVLMLSWEYPPNVVGGLGAHVAALAPALVRAGVDVNVVTPRWKGGALQERLLPSPRSPGAKSPIRKHRLSQSVYRIDPAVGGLGNYFADVQQTNLNLSEQAQALYERLGGFDLIHAHDWLVAFAAGSLKRCSR